MMNILCLSCGKEFEPKAGWLFCGTCTGTLARMAREERRRSGDLPSLTEVDVETLRQVVDELNVAGIKDLEADVKDIIKRVTGQWIKGVDHNET